VIVRDPASGGATGVLLETAATFVRRVAPPPPAPAQLADQLADAMRLLNSYGIVSVVDPSIDERVGEVYKRLRDEGRMTVRTDVLYKARDLDETKAGIAYTLAQRSDHMLRFPGIKFMLDGGVEGARMHAPYRIVPGEQPRADYRGLLLAPPGERDELIACYRQVAQAGLQAQTHGVGDEAIDFVAGCYEELAREYAIGDLHWCLMHVFLPTGAALEKLAAAGIHLTVQDHPVLLGHNQRRWWGDERAAAAIPIRRLLDAGFSVGGGTDGPVVPVDPFLSMDWMVTRTTLNGDVLGPEHGITPAEALELYTRNNARILNVEDDRGSIEPGKRADLAVLSQDILAVPPMCIRDTRALLTMVDGQVVYRAQDESG
ncbi:MAG: amidohydrolase, partial [Gammaproteobacteria bacterium]